MNNFKKLVPAVIKYDRKDKIVMVCAWCKTEHKEHAEQIAHDIDYKISHGICPTCAKGYK